MSTDYTPPRLPLRVRRYGQHLGHDGTSVFLNGYVVVSPGEEDYEMAYTIALWRHRAQGRRMPYAAEVVEPLREGEGEVWPAGGGWGQAGATG